MSVRSGSQNRHELESFNHEEARFSLQPGSFMDSLSINKPRTQVVAVLGVLLLVTLSCILSCLVFMVILIEHHNHHAATWAFLTAAIGFGISTLFVLHLMTKLEEWHDKKTLEGIKIFGMVTCVISGLAMGIYLILGVLDQNDLTLDGENYYSSTIFSGLCLVASLYLYFVAQWYQNAVQFAETVKSVNMQNIVRPAAQVMRPAAKVMHPAAQVTV